MFRLATITVVTFFICQAQSARILAVFPMPSISHALVFRPLYLELAKRGHELIVITPDPAFPKNASIPNLTEIDVHDLSYSLWKKYLLKQITFGHAGEYFNQIEKMLRAMSIVFKHQIQTPEVRKMIEDNKGKIDLLLLEAPAKACFGLTHIFKVPVISISTLGFVLDYGDLFGTLTHPLLFPVSRSIKHNNFSFWDKIKEMYVHWKMMKLLAELEIDDDKLLKEIIDPNIPPLSELNNNIDLLFVNLRDVWDTNRPVPPNVVYIGGVHSKPPKTLPQDLETYLNSSKHGVIYFSLGTNAVPSALRTELIKSFINVFSKIPYDVLWKWDTDKLPKMPSNVKVFKWLPQSDLLHHPKIKLFITQGGLQSTDEAIEAGVPMIGIPMLSDQWFNVEKYVHFKIGVRLDMEAITEERLMKAINNVIEDNSYRENIKKLRTIFNDKPQEPLERAVWWVEYLLRHGSAKHLRSPSANVPLTRYYEIDLVVIMLVVLVVVFVIVLMALKSILSFFEESRLRLKVNSVVKLKIMLRVFVTISAFTFLIYQVNTARILAVFPVPSISHQVVFRPLCHELARRGHEVIIVTPDPAFPKNLPNLTEIDVHDLSYTLWKDYWVSKINIGQVDDYFNQMQKALEVVPMIFKYQMQTKEVKQMIKENKNKIDLLLIESPAKVALGLSHVFKVPVISICSLGLVWDNDYVIGTPTHPILFPGVTSFKQNDLSYWDKIKEIYVYWKLSRLIEEAEKEDDKMLRDLFDPNIPPLAELNNNIDMMFLNNHDVWDTNRPVPPNLVYIGGIHLNPPKDLPKDLETYLDSSKNGVIYFSLGTNAVPSALQSDIIQSFINVFSRLPYDILWKWDEEELPGKPSNVKIFKWLPQSDLLRHPKIKLFITQGGLQSTDEAIEAGVPLIGIPMLGDQWFNVEKYVQLKIGVRLDMETITEERLMDAITTVVDDKSYRDNIQKLRSIINDKPQKPLERAVWWVEYTLRHGGAKHLRTPSANMPWTKYYEMDLVLLLLTAASVAIALIVVAIKTILKLFDRPVKSKKA
ncbi:uncharacterized protein LOC121728109 [Aricia agestis]|uniref:uncharacterized protein LOC121728109 n=1 Tax=Aricia agestis TaxID=91739 RepID=UPI001C2018B6|nr:uncharacterized protein LOC121728109 [Aricia agestis]